MHAAPPPPSPPSPPTAAAPVRGSSRSRLRLLVVHEDGRFARGLALLLEGYGHRVETWPSGLAALERLCSDAPLPHLVLTSTRLPDVDAWSLVEALRTNPAFPRVPVALLAAADAAPHAGALVLPASARQVPGFLEALRSSLIDACASADAAPERWHPPECELSTNGWL